VSTHIPSPVTFGAWRPAILVPPAHLRQPRDQQHAVACHELLHVRRQDWLVCLLEELAAALMWFHPAVWYLMRRIRSSREQVVDAAVVQLTRRREVYVEALLTAAASIRPMLGVAAAPLFIRRRDLTRRVTALIQENKPMSTPRALFSGTCIATALLAAGMYGTLTFPLTGAPQTQPGTIARAEARNLPELLQKQVEARLSGLRGQTFTSDVMTQVNKDLANMDPKLARMWVEETPGVYSLVVTYKAAGSAIPKVAAIDASRIPEPSRTLVTARLNGMVNAPVTNPLFESIRANAAAVDRRISPRWRDEPDGSMVLVLGWDLPDKGYQPVTGVLKTIDVSHLPETDRANMEQRLAPFLNAPMTNSQMDRIRQATADVPGHWAYGWMSKGDETTLTVSPVPPATIVANTGENVIRLGTGVLAGKRIAGQDPEYPPLAQQVRIQGVVRLTVEIAADGHVRKMNLVGGHPLLVSAATEAVRTWQYQTTLLNGLPVAVTGDVEVPFSLPAR